MKRKLLTVTLIACMSLSLLACGNKEEAATAEVSTVVEIEPTSAPESEAASETTEETEAAPAETEIESEPEEQVPVLLQASYTRGELISEVERISVEEYNHYDDITQIGGGWLEPILKEHLGLSNREITFFIISGDNTLLRSYADAVTNEDGSSSDAYDENGDLKIGLYEAENGKVYHHPLYGRDGSTWEELDAITNPFTNGNPYGPEGSTYAEVHDYLNQTWGANPYDN